MKACIRSLLLIGLLAIPIIVWRTHFHAFEAMKAFVFAVCVIISAGFPAYFYPTLMGKIPEKLLWLQRGAEVFIVLSAVALISSFVIGQLKTNYDYFAPNLVDQFPTFAAKYIQDNQEKTHGHWELTKVKEPKLYNFIPNVECSYDFNTRLFIAKPVI